MAPDAWEYIQKIRDVVHDLEQRTQKAKDNVEAIIKLMNAWSKQPLFERKEGTFNLYYTISNSIL